MTNGDIADIGFVIFMGPFGQPYNILFILGEIPYNAILECYLSFIMKTSINATGGNTRLTFWQ